MIIKTILNDRSSEFLVKNARFGDALMGLMAAGIDAKIKTSGEVPFLPKSTKWAQRGALRASVRHNKISMGHYEVSVGENSPAEAYAAAQEAGVTRGHPIRNYSTPGTGAHFTQHAIEDVVQRRPEYVKAAQEAAGLVGL